MRKLFLLLLLVGSLALHAASINVGSLMNAQRKEAHQLPRQMVTYCFNINTGYDVTFSHELDYQWYPLKYMGIGIGVEYDKNDVVDQQSRDEKNGWGYSYDKDAVVRLNFLPMLSFRTPSVWFSYDRSWGIMLRCDPMIMLSVPTNDHMWITPEPFPGTDNYREGNVKVSNHGGKWLSWRVRSALSFYNEFGMISIGYSFSNYNLYSCRNNMVYRGKKIFNRGQDDTSTLFISIGVCF